MELSYIIIGVAILGLIFFFYYGDREYEHAKIGIGNKTLDVEVAQSYVQKARGLIGHAPVSDSQGMLFVNSKEEDLGIWMMNMSFPIDILWIDKDLKITHIVENAQPCIVNCTVYRSNYKSLYVLEVQSGFVKRHKVAVGDKIKFRK